MLSNSGRLYEALKPFFRHGRTRFFFASPEACAFYVSRGAFAGADYVFVVNDWYIPGHPPGVQAYRQLAASGFGNLRILCGCDEDIGFLADELNFPQGLALLCPWQFSHGLARKNSALAFNPLAPARFDAVLNARSAPYKNRWAAAGVSNLALLDYDGAEPEIESRYHNTRRLSLKEVVPVVQASKVGLALSFMEGACRASLEYLLCGLPVVSTASLGGRDHWYDEDNCILVGPPACEGLAGRFDKAEVCEQVAAAVATWVERLDADMVDRAGIRQSAIAVSRAFENRFLEAVTSILRENGAEADDPTVLAGLVDGLASFWAYGAYLEA